MSTRNSGDLMQECENFSRTLEQAGVCFTLVVGVPGIRHQRYWTNLSRFGDPGIDEFERQVKELANKCRHHRRRLEGG